MFFLLLLVFGGVFLSCFGVVLVLNSYGLACVICLGSLERSVFFETVDIMPAKCFLRYSFCGNAPNLSQNEVG